MKENRGNKHRYSLETIFHYRCAQCQLWWSVADARFPESETTCPHCGYKAETSLEEPKPPVRKILSILPSQLEGRGVYACVPFRSGEKIGDVVGELITTREYEKRAVLGKGGYGVNVGSKVLDPDRACTLAYANDADGPTKKRGLSNNAEFRSSGESVSVYATRDIGVCEEILVRYGKNFWLAYKAGRNA